MNSNNQGLQAMKLQETISQLQAKVQSNNDRMAQLAGGIICDEVNWRELYAISFALEAMVEQQIKLLQSWGGPELVTTNNKKSEKGIPD